MEPIAIVGTGCRFPGGANTPSKLWELLQNPRDVLSRIPTTRFNAKAFYHPDGLHHGTSNVQHAYLLSEDLRHFDAPFFNIKPVEAESIDPQHRLLLETVYEALETGGLTVENLRGSDTAVFVGQMINDYNDHLIRDLDDLPTYFATGTSRAITSNRVSYFFDWHGPSSTMDTACSSSLVALHQAVRSLRSGECSMAVVGGVNLLLGPEWYIGESKLKMLSPEGRSRMWDAAANGYARGEGVAAVILKKLSDAIAAGDHVECVIRETGVNQDGRTQGITMPNHTAQTALIRDTYARAGLDLSSSRDMPQFFEAHGTGTQAGDGKEAQAIHDAFFGATTKEKKAFHPPSDQVLFVGSIKTVIGHTEGTAGLAGLLKASLALQNGVIPPNMLFNRLNPNIEPFYENLRILTESRPWPVLPEGQPRRASVNSFGFGGTNSHAILESYTPPKPILKDGNCVKSSILPFIFSAVTSSSLARTIEAYSKYLRSHPSTSLLELAHTLTSHRSRFPVRVAFSANSLEMLCDAIDNRLKELQQAPAATLGVRLLRTSILGIFTGQGAQWPEMGKELIRSSSLVRASFNALEKSLAELQADHRPTWSLRDEIMRDMTSSRMAEAEIAQPVCTAIQIVLVDLLSSLGVKFAAVVGHSSGEIAAAYAAGYLSATDAIRIAYYRGFFAKLSCGPKGQKGAMMAVAASYQEAKEFCDSTQMRGRISIAASNSPTSVTLSGDAEMIIDSKAIFDQKKIFARILKVNTAYHSHHMLGCAGAYLKALRECQVKIKRPNSKTKCVWYSSVNEGGPVEFHSELADIYWRDNMVKPVLFTQALRGAMTGNGSLNLAIEVGPHPALKGPAQQTIQDLAENMHIAEGNIPYSGTLMRGKHDSNAFADAIGFLWMHGGDDVVKFEGVSSKSRPNLLKDLPSYSWDHDQKYWKESRYTKAFRLRETQPDELLGTRILDGTEQELRWRNMIRPRELPWLSGHRLQGQIVFPAAGYASMAIQAAQALPIANNSGTVRLFEVLNLYIGRPITFDTEMSSVETLFSINNIVTNTIADPQRGFPSCHATFSCYSSTNGGSTAMQLVANGRIRIELGELSASTLPQRSFEASTTDMRPVNDSAFYAALENLGYEYADNFRALSSMQRKLNVATGKLPNYTSASLLIHPATLDLAVQSALVAFCAPRDADLWALHVPTSIARISVNPFLCQAQQQQQQQQQCPNTDFDMLPFRTCLLESSSTNTIVGDVSVFADNNINTWIQVEGLSMVPLSVATASDDRPLFSQNVWGPALPSSGWAEKFLDKATYKDAENSDFQSTLVSGEVNGDYVPLPNVSLNHLASLVAGLAHRYSSMNILEISSNNGEAMTNITPRIRGAVDLYTIANMIRGSADEQVPKFQGSGGEIESRTIDFEADFVDQGFMEGSYDLIIMTAPLSSNFSSKKRQLATLRNLLKRGGYLMGLDMKFSGLPSSDLEPSSKLSPCPLLSTTEWNALLRASGFSGIENERNEDDGYQSPKSSVFVAQATDDEVLRLRQPLSIVPSNQEIVKQLFLIGGERCLRHEIEILLEQHYVKISTVRRIEDINEDDLPTTSTVLCLAELEEPCFKSMTRDRIEGLKALFKQARNILWVTAGARDDPYLNMTRGFARSVQAESVHLRLQFLDFAQLELPSPRLVAEALLRLEITDYWGSKGLHQDILWTTEPEYMYKNGSLLISRIMPLNAANNRQNSVRREIEKQVSPSTCNVRIVRSGSSISLEEDHKAFISVRSREDKAIIRVMYSALSALQITDTSRLFLSLGRTVKSGETVIALSEDSSSILHVSSKSMLAVSPPQGQEAQYLSLVSNLLLARRLLELTSARSNFLVHEPSPLLASALSHLAYEHEELKRVCFTTEHVDTGSQPTFIHSRTPERLLKSLIPGNISAFLNFSFSDEMGVASFLKNCISPPCQFLGRQSCIGPLAYFESHENFLNILRATDLAATSLKFDASSCSKIALRDLSRTLSADPLSVIDWTASPTVTIKTTPVTSNILFAKDKTYVLFGLTGAMGRSICEWMVAHGARNVVLTSRSPKVNEAWLASFKTLGATVMVLKSDLNDKASIQNCYDQICKTLPSIAGVAHGAMVLQDTLFSEMTPEAMQTVLEPKVAGSRHLDEIFSSDHPLDFFILFSSIVSETGSIGQTNYAAANSYLTGLASQRRKRGLVATTINLGVVGGLGYVGQADSYEMATMMKNNLQKVSPHRMSERDVHTMFAEAVLMSRAGPNEDPVIIGGLTTVKPTEVLKPYWYENPRFQYWTPRHEDGKSGAKKGKSTESLAAQLLSAKTKEDSNNILRTAFFAYLETSLQIKTRSDLLLTGLDELGIDSLSALDIRSWFVTNVQADVPVLKILGGATVGDLLDYSIDKMARNLAPSAGESISEEPNGPDLGQQPLINEKSTPARDTSRPSLLRTERLSVGQSRFWFLRSYLEDKTTSNIVTSHRLTGKLRISDLAEAVRELGQRHEALRTCFFDDGDVHQARQGVLESSRLRLQRLEIPTKEDVRMEYMKLLKHEYDLERGDTMRIVLLSLSSSSEYYILIAYHHIIMDGMSLMILLADLEKFYNQEPNVAQIIQYPDFTLRQRREIDGGKFGKELDYWRNEFPDIPPALPLFPVSRVSSRQTLKRYFLNKVTVRLSAASTKLMKKVSREAKVTAFHFYLAVLKSLIQRFASTDDFCIGIADANRNDFDTVQAIGMYLNLLPLRFRSKDGETFLDLLLDAKAKARAALIHSRVPFDLLLETLEVPRSASHSPLFQAFFDYRQGYKREARFGDCVLDEFEFEAGETAYDISLDIMEDASTESVITLKTQSYLYSQEDTEILMKSYMHLLNAYAANPDCLLIHPRLFSTADVQKAISIGRGPNLRSDWAPTLSHRVDEIMNSHPTRLAVKDGHGNSLTYSQMSQEVNAIATALLATGVGIGSTVAVFQEPTVEWICSLLAILRIGSIYVPLDLRNPLERLAANVQAAQPSAILTDDATSGDTLDLKGGNAKFINVSSIKKHPMISSPQVPNRASAESPAIILFTSGTTGTPKGIVLRHSSIRNEIEGYTKTWEVDSEIVLQQSAFSFDFSLDQIFSALSTGSTLYVVPKTKRGDPVEIARIIVAEEITYTKATPSEYISWIQYGGKDLATATSWRKAFAGGERLTDHHRQAFRSLNNTALQLINSYGPGEISISSSKILVPYNDKNCDALDVIPAGKCLPNYSVYIVDENLEPVPVGVPGEVLIGGAGPALGYLANEVLTREKFLPDKYACAEYVENSWTTLYRSADRGRLRSDGALLFEGRIDGDSQIKLRGLRIELQDIESTIVRTSSGALTEAVVSVRGDPEFLVAHVVFSPSYPDERRSSLIRKLKLNLPLPQYMCPARIIPLEQMPLTSHFKLDRRAISALPLPKSPVSHEKRVANGDGPQLTYTETWLRGVWMALLPPDSVELSTIDSETDFFGVGGNSALLPSLQIKIRNALGAVIPLYGFFEATTLGLMAAKIEESKPTSTIDWVNETSVSDLTFEIGRGKCLDSIFPTKITPGKVVLLTGATGFLGRNILQQLVADRSISEINCVAVRANAGSVQDRIAIKSDKVNIYEGDLAAPRLGLSVKDFVFLAGRTHAIIHSAAMRAFFENYEILRGANVESTKEIIRLALPRRVPIHFISSGGLLKWDVATAETGGSAAGSLAHVTPPINGSDGYLATKWASEVALENAGAQYGIPVYIHRALSRDGANDSEKYDEVMQGFSLLAKAANALPDLAGWTGDIDLVHVSHVVDGICKSLVPKITVARPPPLFQHYPGQLKITFEQLEGYLVSGPPGAEFSRVNVLKWFGQIKTLGFEYIISAQNLTKDQLVSRR